LAANEAWEKWLQEDTVLNQPTGAWHAWKTFLDAHAPLSGAREHRLEQEAAAGSTDNNPNPLNHPNHFPSHTMERVETEASDNSNNPNNPNNSNKEARVTRVVDPNEFSDPTDPNNPNLRESRSNLSAPRSVISCEPRSVGVTLDVSCTERLRLSDTLRGAPPGSALVSHPPRCIYWT
jgi:hypothetical protein